MFVFKVQAAEICDWGSYVKESLSGIRMDEPVCADKHINEHLRNTLVHHASGQVKAVTLRWRYLYVAGPLEILLEDAWDKDLHPENEARLESKQL